jgi:hypothetical protein
MKVERLSPIADQQTQFAWSHCTQAPDKPGCYALATYGGDVLYVGLATKSIRNRMRAHLDSPSKRRGEDLGVPFWLFYTVRPAKEVGPIERGWMNQAILEDGDLPPMNRIYSPL